MVLLLKRYIYLKKEDQNCLSLHGLTAFFKMIEIVERRIAQERDKLVERRIAQERDKLDFHYRDKGGGGGGGWDVGWEVRVYTASFLLL